MLKLSDFDYDLPDELIAQFPLKKRDEARLLIVDRKNGSLTHDVFHRIGHYLPAPSLLVINDSKVIPARLLGKKPRTGGAVEVFLLKQIDDYCFEALLKPLKKIQTGERMDFPGGLSCVLEDPKLRVVRFDEKNILAKLEKSGHIPLPPYIHRQDEEIDREYYQTVYAARPGSVAAPTAGLHFTDSLMTRLKSEGHSFAQVTLHVNYGTFKPVETENIVDHPMHLEAYEIPESTGSQIQAAKRENRAVVCVGTTSCRSLEAAAREGRSMGETRLFLYPGAEFKVTDALITNFHLPRSTLLMLVCAFAGTDLIRRAYAEAIREKYRFFSYGDAMLIL